jgi:predicted nucleic acid-binding protein
MRSLALKKQFSFLPDVPEIYTVWKELVRVHRVQGVKVHEARLVAVMQVHSVNTLLTFNAPDFARFTGVTAIHPSTLSP